LDILALLVSALCHDLGHPGFNNAFQVNAQTELAIKYNDMSVLENHHSSLTFRVLQDPECNILQNLNEDQKKEIRRTMIQLILATDMSSHFEHVSKFRHHVETQPFDRNKKEDRQMILNVLLKCADLSNVAKPWQISENWSDRVADEFFHQSDFERDNKYPVAPFMDRTKTTRPRIAADFQDFVAMPIFKVLALFLPNTQVLVDHITSNRAKWQLRLDDVAYNVPDTLPLTTTTRSRSRSPLTPVPEELDPVEDLNKYSSEEENENEGEGEEGEEEEEKGKLEDKSEASNLVDQSDPADRSDPSDLSGPSSSPSPRPS